MSNILPLFTSAPRLKLAIGGTTVAYAIGFDVSISIDVTPVMAIGQFGPFSLEPTMYNVVTGTMQIVRLVSASKITNQVANIKPSSLIGNTPDMLMGTGPDGSVATGQTTASTLTNSIASIKKLHSHLDPSKVLSSASFNIDVYFRVPEVLNTATTTAAGVQSYNGNGKEKNWIRIQNCRLTGRNTNIALGALVNEPVNFMGTLLTVMNDSEAAFGQDNGPSEVAKT